MKLLNVLWKVVVGLFMFIFDALATDTDNKPVKNEYTGRMEYKGQGHYEHVHRDEYGQKIEDD